MVKRTKCLGKVWCWGWWLSVQSVWVRFGVGGGGVWTGFQSVHSLCSYRIPHALSSVMYALGCCIGIQRKMNYITILSAYSLCQCHNA